jgi:heme O synthase-like polyprenyltransferase
MTTATAPRPRPRRTKSTGSSTAIPALAVKTAPLPVRPRFADYGELTKPRIATMALITVAVGYLMGAAP